MNRIPQSATVAAAAAAAVPQPAQRVAPQSGASLAKWSADAATAADTVVFYSSVVCLMLYIIS